MPYLGNPTPRLLWCPSDRTLVPYLNLLHADRTARFPNYYRGHYVFSYGLSVHESHRSGKVPERNRRPEWYRGMASAIIANNPTPGGIGTGFHRPMYDPDNVYHFKATSIQTPSEKILFADKRFETAAGEFYPDSYREGSAWYWPDATLTRQHHGRGTVVMADGGVRTVRPEFAARPEHYDPWQ